jgi:alkylation response protein AidB-like acyl-CoA dehydrogenase
MIDAQTFPNTGTRANEVPNYLSHLEELIRTRYSSTILPAEPLAREHWAALCDAGIMKALLPESYGGRDNHQELCALIEGIARHNLPLSMYTMIITSLFVRNVVKYGSVAAQQEVLPLFASQPMIGGFALTEPGCGSNLARMSTVFEKEKDGYRIRGQKHWQAFSITADWWLVAAKDAAKERHYGYFIVKREEGFRNIEAYNALGLKAIDYGLNEIDAWVPAYRRLEVTAEGLEGAVDMLCASRLSMCAMASGFTQRIYAEALLHTENRRMGNGTLAKLGYVQHKLAQMNACHTISKALLTFVSEQTDFRNNLVPHFFEAQAVKTLATDKMLESALLYQQLSGGEGYRYNASANSAAFALLDARVYTIFDGTNDLLSQQLADYCLSHSKDGDVLSFLQEYELTAQGMQQLSLDLSILNQNGLHAQKVLNGQIIARIFGLNCLDSLMKGRVDRHACNNFVQAVAFLTADIKRILAEAEILTLGGC